MSRRVGHATLAVALAALAFSAGAPAAENADEPLKIVFIAYESPNQLMEDVRPVVAYLEKSLGRSVRAFVATDYAGVVEALRYGNADAGFMGPLQYVIARQQAGARPILGEVYAGKPTYTARLFVRRDSGIDSPAALAGRTIAFVDPISSSGYLYPLDIFRTAGLIAGRDDAEKFFRKIYFAGGDEQALRAVLNGFVDAAGVGQYSWSLLRAEERDQIVSIAESRPIPSHGVVVRAGLEESTARALADALLALNGPEHAALRRALYNVDGYVEVGPEDYDSVEALAREYGFLPKTGGGR